MLYDKFGEFDSADEINASAEGLFNEGDYENIKVLAKENGIDAAYVDMYIAGDIPVLCDVASAALDKLDVEAAELTPVEIMEDWLDYIRVCCTEDDQMAQAVRRKGKSLKGCIGALLSWSFKGRYKVDADIVKAANIGGNARVEMGIPGMGTAKHLTNTVYLYPKDLRAKHNEAAHRLAVQQDQKKKQEKNEQYKNIAKNYKKLCKKYAYEDGDFMIRPAASAGEIIEEGRELHHCVGGDYYLSKHSNGTSYILFMRYKKSPGIPLCTIEIKDKKIVQWYEAHDQKQDKEIIQPWLDKYIKHLKEEEHGTNRTELAAG